MAGAAPYSGMRQKMVLHRGVYGSSRALVSWAGLSRPTLYIGYGHTAAVGVIFPA